MPKTSNQKSRPLVNRLLSSRNLGLTAPQKFVLMALVDHYNPKKSVKVWPGITTMSEITGYSERTVIRSLADLEEMGLFNAEHHNGSKTIYYLATNAIESLVDQCHRVTTAKRTNDRESPPPVTESHIPVTESHRTSDRESQEPVIEPAKNRLTLTGSGKNRQKSSTGGFVNPAETIPARLGKNVELAAKKWNPNE